MIAVLNVFYIYILFLDLLGSLNYSNSSDL